MSDVSRCPGRPEEVIRSVKIECELWLSVGAAKNSCASTLRQTVM